MSYIILEVTLGTAGYILSLVLALIIGLVVGFVVTKSMLQKQLKKNPPINEKMIRAMFMQMGRKPSEADIRRVMNSMKK